MLRGLPLLWGLPWLRGDRRPSSSSGRTRAAIVVVLRDRRPFGPSVRSASLTAHRRCLSTMSGRGAENNRINSSSDCSSGASLAMGSFGRLHVSLVSIS